MANIVNHKTVYGAASNIVEYRTFLWDVANGDVGTAAAYNICTAGETLIIVHAHLKVLTLVSTGSSPTIKWGVTGDDDRFCNATQGAAASLTAGAVVLPLALEGTPNVIATPYKIAAADNVLMTIGTATITTGKIIFTVGFLKP